MEHEAHPQQFDEWLHAAEQRYLADLTFAEVTRALRALSSCYVERRHRLRDGSALDGAGKRAAFALFYGPLHALLTYHVITSLGPGLRSSTTVLDLGCGTGAASAAWALAARNAVAIEGVDRHPWAVHEAAWTWRMLGVRGRAVRADISRARVPGGPAACVCAFTVNELAADAREHVRTLLLEAAAAGHAVLVVEPIARGAAPWWREWTAAFAQGHAREDEWRVPMRLPALVARLDRAAGLRHDELTARTIYVPQR
jgi:SAM-dependent methyltransferase